MGGSSLKPELSNNFTAGIISPRLSGRVDLPQFKNGVADLENMVVYPYGSVTRRPGTAYISDLPDGAIRLHEFKSSPTDVFLLVFSDKKLWIYQDDLRVQKLAVAGNHNDLFKDPLYKSILYTDQVGANIFHTDGWTCKFPPKKSKKLEGQPFNQNRDYMHPETWVDKTPPDSSQPNWYYTSKGEAFLQIKIISDKKYDETAAVEWLGALKLPLVAGQRYMLTWQAVDEGLFEIKQTFAEGELGAYITVSVGGVRTLYSSSKVGRQTIVFSLTEREAALLAKLPTPYISFNFRVAPVLNQKFDTYGLSWLYNMLDTPVPGYGVRIKELSCFPVYDSGDLEKITPYIGEELSRLSFAQVVDHLYICHPNHPPHYLSFGSDSEDSSARRDNDAFVFGPVKQDDYPAELLGEGNHPGAVGYYQRRLWYGGTYTNPSTIWASALGNTQKFLMSGDTDAAKAFSFSLGGSEILDSILWFLPSKKFLVGTEASEWAIEELTHAEALHGGNISCTRETTYGSTIPGAKTFGSTILFPGPGGRQLCTFSYSMGSDNYNANNLTLYNDLLQNDTILDYHYASLPFGMIWLLTTNGQLLSCTFSPEEQVLAWARHTTVGKWIGLCVLHDHILQGRSVPYLAVTRLVKDKDGGKKAQNVLEKLAPFNNEQGSLCNARYLDGYNKFYGPEVLFLSFGVAKFKDPFSGVPEWTYYFIPQEKGDFDKIKTGDMFSFSAISIRDEDLSKEQETILAHAQREIAWNEWETILGKDPATLRCYINAKYSGPPPEKSEPIFFNAGSSGRSAITKIPLHYYRRDGQAPVVCNEHGSKIFSDIDPKDPDFISFTPRQSEVLSGLPYISQVTTLGIEDPSFGTLQGRLLRIPSILIRFYNTLGATCWKLTTGATGEIIEEELGVVKFLQTDTPYGTTPPLFTGDKIFPLSGSYTRSSAITLGQTDPYPFTVLFLIRQLSPGDIVANSSD